MRLVVNNASSTLFSDITDSATSLTVAAGNGDLFPSPGAGEYAMITLEDTTGEIEIVKMTSITGDVMTVERAQEGTVARAFVTGDRVELRSTAGLFELFYQKNEGDIIDGTDEISIQTKAYTTTGAAPGSGDLIEGELAVNIPDKNMWVGAVGATPSVPKSPIQIITAGSAVAPGLTTNYLLNPEFSVWQMGTTIAADGEDDGELTADRWYFWSPSAFMNANVTAAPVPVSNNTDPPYYMQLDSITNSGSARHLYQVIEDGAALLAGKTVTLSALVYCSQAGTFTLGLMNWKDGSGWSVTSSGISYTAFGTWQWIEATLDCTNIDRTAQTNIRAVITLPPDLPYGPTDLVRISKVKLEVGTARTEFQPTIYSDQLWRCRRYLQRKTNVAIMTELNGATVSGLATARSGWVPYNPPLYPTPQSPVMTFGVGDPANPSAWTGSITDSLETTEGFGFIYQPGAGQETSPVFITHFLVKSEVGV